MRATPLGLGPPLPVGAAFTMSLTAGDVWGYAAHTAGFGSAGLAVARLLEPCCRARFSGAGASDGRGL